MNEVRIDRIHLQVTGLNVDAAAQFARLVAQNLVPSVNPLPGQARTEMMAFEVAWNTGEQPEHLARRIAASLAHQISTLRWEQGL